MQDIGQPQGHWVIRSWGLSLGTQVLLISLFCNSCEGSIVKQMARWQPMPYGSSTCSIQTWWRLTEDKRFSFAAASLETKTFSPEKPSNSFPFPSLGQDWVTHRFLSQSLARGGVTFTPVKPISELGVESGSPQTGGDFLERSGVYKDKARGKRCWAEDSNVHYMYQFGKKAINLINSLINRQRLFMFSQSTQDTTQTRSEIKVKCLAKMYVHKKETGIEIANKALNRPRGAF